MSDEGKPRPPAPLIVDGAQDATVIAALNEHYMRARQAAHMSSVVNPPHVPAPPPQPVLVHDSSQDAATFAVWEAHRRQLFVAATTGTIGYVPAPADEFPVLVSKSVIIPYGATGEGQLIRAVTLPLLDIIRMIAKDPKLMYAMDPRKWEEIIAATYEASGQFDRVTLTPCSGDYGRDLIAEKDGFGSVRLIESVKRYKPGNEVTADEVRALLGVLSGDQKATKGVVSTTWEFAPKLKEDIFIKPFLPYRLELVNGADLVQRLTEYAIPKSQ